MKTLYFLPLLLLFLSCKNEKEQQLKRDIVGEWKFAKFEYLKIHEDSFILPPPPLYGDKLGYEFKTDGTYEDKFRFGWLDTLNGHNNGRWHDWGNISKYEINEDSLRLYNPVYKKWTSKKIASITADTLTLQSSDSVFVKYARLHCKSDSSEDYDQIIVSSSGCYGSCPVLDISISKNGDVLFYGQEYTLHDGRFTSKISKVQFDEIVQRFRKANIKSLSDNYSASHTDDRTVTVTFIKNGSVYKTISDYGNEAPATFNWAYTPVLSLYQHIKLIPVSIKFSLPTWGSRFTNAKSSCFLEKTEAFYLSAQLRKAKRSETIFKPVYWIDYDKGETRLRMLTDGRYYKFPPEDGGETLDLGYNFIEKNGLEKRFVKVDD